MHWAQVRHPRRLLVVEPVTKNVMAFRSDTSKVTAPSSRNLVTITPTKRNRAKQHYQQCRENRSTKSIN